MRNLFIMIAGLFFLVGCAGSSGYNYKVNTKPYTVNGRTYYPMASANGFSETGVASWYGPDFHGKQTASGEIYDKYAFTAAHKTLPFGTRVRVTSLDTGASTTVVINDRGPFKSGRIIDLSYSAAKEIGMVGRGTARVRINTIGSTNNTATTKVAKTNASAATGAGNYYVQVGTYSVQNNATKASQNLTSLGYANSVKTHSGKYVVRAGPYGTHARAATVRDKLRKNYSGAFIVE